MKAYLPILLAPLLLAAIVLGTFGFIAVALMDHDFEGGGPREWLLVRGTLLAHLGLVAPEGVVRYSSRAQDGLKHESNGAIYASRRSAPDVIAAYATACSVQALVVAQSGSLIPPSRPDELSLTCEGEAGTAVVTATPTAAGSTVIITVRYPLQ